MRKSLPAKRATLEDVARVAGVGAMTVSRTINGHPYVSEETAKRVRAAIRQLDYRPNHAARMLTGQLSRSIGLIVPDLADTFFSIVSHAVQETARESGYLVWLAASNDDPAIEAAQVEQMTHHPVDGILLVPVDSKDRYLKTLASGATPIVTIDRPIEVATTDSVGVENRAGARMAVEHLIHHGHARIACVATNTHLLTIKERLIGFEESLRHARLPMTKALRLSNRDAVKPALAEMFASRNRPEALFTANNASTIWVIEALREMKIEMGKHVALVGFDDVDFFTLITPPVTAVRQPAAELGRMSARLLLQRIKGEFTASSVRTVLPVSLVIRESCGCYKRTD
ncbi:LacI family DNA-binding transcriptional regulator [Edaphobacter sp.]|uniref:LacI family DNA-binding transcriptional regulator n=1 Tax=Edaphobacter sp. TaxID=1934404 RepID=UPI002DBC9E13|nr:LacI family DNA-binding transcriptional regulator [Edaphobacter sp.]HEU5340798.1 LacI family DNA-binding transcriptional regulator [Edaphobacter sp.]